MGLPKFARSVNWGHVVHDRLGDSHPKLQVQRVTEDQAEISTNRRTVRNPADQLIDKKSVCSWMVTMCFTRFPERFLSSKLVRDGVVIQYGRRGIPERGLTGLMGKNME